MVRGVRSGDIRGLKFYLGVFIFFSIGFYILVIVKISIGNVFDGKFYSDFVRCFFNVCCFVVFISRDRLIIFRLCDLL